MYIRDNFKLYIEINKSFPKKKTKTNYRLEEKYHQIVEIEIYLEIEKANCVDVE